MLKVNKFFCCFLVLYSMLLGFFTLAQSDFSSQSIVINPSPTYQVNIYVDKDPSGTTTPSYTIGEEIRIGVQPSETSYIYLFNIRSNGKITQILPNRLDSSGTNNLVHASQTRYFPEYSSSYKFTIDGPEGLEKVIAVASKQPLDTRTLVNFTSDGSFATSSMGENSFASALSIIVTPLPIETWVTATAIFYVTIAPPPIYYPPPPDYPHPPNYPYPPSHPVPPIYPPPPDYPAPPIYPPPTTYYGSLDINSYPAGAAIYINGQFMGYTPNKLFDINVGSQVIQLELNGYLPFNTTINLQPNEVHPIYATLQPNHYPNYPNYPVYPIPTSKKDCKKGNWRNLYKHDGTTFKNQGDCISYVNHYY